MSRSCVSFFEIGHQAAQLVVPALLGPQALELEVEPFALKIVHALARRAQPAAGASHRIGNQDRHLRIAAVDIVAVGQQPPRGIGLSGFDDVLLLPRADAAVGLDQLRRVEDIAADRLIAVSFSGHVQQREIIGRGEERHPLLAGLRQQVHGLRRKRIAQKAVQLRGAFHRHRQMKPEIVPPDGHLTVFVFITHPLRETEPRGRRFAVLDLLHQQMQHALPVVGPDLPHLGIESRRPALGADADTLHRKRRQFRSSETFEQVEQVDKQVRAHLHILQTARKKLPQQRQRPHRHPLAGRQFIDLPPVVIDQQPNLLARIALRGLRTGDPLAQTPSELHGVAARLGGGDKFG